LSGKALLHGHCHHRATGGIGSEKKLLERLGLEVEELDSGCCGMAGAWGYELGHYDVSIACAERALLPKLRSAEPDTLIVADGFSCKTQIEQAQIGRTALHLAEVLALARRGQRPTRPNATLARRGLRAAAEALLAVGALELVRR
jgi:Fe-S oxidoreductase